ncbi:NACHT domain-containing protein [Saccharothrix stipae]
MLRTHPSLTFQGALRILGKYEPRGIGVLDKALGGAILGAGAVALGGAALVPLALVTPLWGWVDQKNEAVGLLRSLAQGLSDRLMGVHGLERRELIAAAHSTIVASAFFEVFEEYVGSKRLKRLAITARERHNLVTGAEPDKSVAFLLKAEIPHPSPARGFHENLPHVQTWVEELADRTHDFLDGLAEWPGDSVRYVAHVIAERTVERYASRYLELAARVPEFLIWSTHGEHAATRAVVRAADESVRVALAAQGDALARVEALLDLVAGRVAHGEQPGVLRRANQGVLALPVVPNDVERYGADVTFPTIGKVFVTPRYRIAAASSQSRPADEHWWGGRPVLADLDVMMAGHLMSPDATRLPLLVLGHPGAGKSLLTKVLAARLPAADYTAVRVPLRNVGANAPILDQVQQALDLATNRRVRWHELTDQSVDTVRVVLLDGLDELLQAARHDRGGYLQQVVEFQRIEAEQHRPVVVVVTSRTVVADRVDIPADVTVVKLEDFTESQVRAWLRAWREANASAIAAGRVRALTEDEAQNQSVLVRQPLLLLMLALYAADPAAPKIRRDLTGSALYERIFDNFARREVRKRAAEPLSPEELERGVRDQVRRLSVAALAMFNRGVQHLREDELQADLEALGVVPADARGDRHGKRLLGEFFFVHTAEANLGHHTERAYEFLHATFGEYLVAHFAVNVLLDVAASAYGGNREAREPDDDRLFAILSHQVFTSRYSVVKFAMEMLHDQVTAEERANVREVLFSLLASYRRRRDSPRYASYRPTRVDHVRQLATYSANLVVLAAAVSTEVPLTVFGDPDEAPDVWRSTVDLWRSGLSQDGLPTVLTWLKPTDAGVAWSDWPYQITGPGWTEYALARLVGDDVQAKRMLYGIAVAEGQALYDEDAWADSMASWLVPLNGGHHVLGRMHPPPPGTPDEDVRWIAGLITDLIGVNSPYVPDAALAEWVRFLLREFPKVYRPDPRALLRLAYFHPHIFIEHRDLHDPALFVDLPEEAKVVLASVAAKGAGDKRIDARWDRVTRRILGEVLPAVGVDTDRVDAVVRALVGPLR